MVLQPSAFIGSRKIGCGLFLYKYTTYEVHDKIGDLILHHSEYSAPKCPPPPNLKMPLSLSLTLITASDNDMRAGNIGSCSLLPIEYSYRWAKNQTITHR